MTQTGTTAAPVVVNALESANARIEAADYSGALAILRGIVGPDAALQRARIGYMRSHWRFAARCAAIACESEDPETRGRGWHILGAALADLGHKARASECFDRALGILEPGVWRACALNDYATKVLLRDDPASAREASGLAQDTVLREGDLGRTVLFGAAVSDSFYVERRYGEVLRKLDTLESMAADMPATLCHILGRRVLANSALGDRHAAHVAAERFVAASVAGSDYQRAIAPVLLRRTQAALGDESALVDVGPLLRPLRKMSPAYAALANLFLFAGLIALDPLEACRRQSELYAPALAHSGQWFIYAELRALEAAPWTLPPMMTLDDAYARVEALAFSAAHRQGKGRATRMRPLLGRPNDNKIAQRARELGLSIGPAGRPAKDA